MARDNIVVIVYKSNLLKTSDKLFVIYMDLLDIIYKLTMHYIVYHKYGIFPLCVFPLRLLFVCSEINVQHDKTMYMNTLETIDIKFLNYKIKIDL